MIDNINVPLRTCNDPTPVAILLLYIVQYLLLTPANTSTTSTYVPRKYEEYPSIPFAIQFESASCNVTRTLYSAYLQYLGT